MFKHEKERKNFFFFRRNLFETPTEINFFELQFRKKKEKEASKPFKQLIYYVFIYIIT